MTRKLNVKAKRPMTAEELATSPDIPHEGDKHPRNAMTAKSVKVIETARDNFLVLVEYA